MSLQRPVHKDRGQWDIGGRADLLYGTDYFFVTTVGLELHRDGTQRWNGNNGGPRAGGAQLYGLALPQLYAEVFAPIGNGATVKLGHFYTILGQETVTSPDNFFYSHSYAMQYGEPFTHTGVLVDYDLTPQWTIRGGMTRGWDTWEDPNDSMGFLGSIEWLSCDGQTSLALAVHTGNEDPTGENNRTTYSLVYSRQLTPCLAYVLQHDFGIEENAEIDRNSERSGAKWYGINQHLIYSLNEVVELGLRAEWFRDQDNARVLGIPIESSTSGANYVAVSAGVNWRPHPSMVVRPELRWDWSDVTPPGGAGMFNDFTEDDQLTLAVDLTIRF